MRVASLRIAALSAFTGLPGSKVVPNSRNLSITEMIENQRTTSLPSKTSKTEGMMYLSFNLSLLTFSLQALDVGLPQGPDLKLRFAIDSQLQISQ
jgi:hypothetical protein